ncbi:protein MICRORCHIDIA 6-like isoform X2 [Cynara cardunculus var. scolymus]|uniref:protein MICRORCHIDIA 6-like isoform X2 n=1 Tax=Cynara cardunculus var. scolymus TaxID=59895 RepID=UPI000D62B633|nr:protein MICRORCHIDIA 6-like isoform X2 [Cynara cardunculus var. scolymus]
MSLNRENCYCNNLDMFELCGDYSPGEVDTRAVKLELNSVGITSEQNQYLPDVTLHRWSTAQGRTHESEKNRSLSASSTGQSGTCILDQEQSQVGDSDPCSTSSISAAPICRQFWKAGIYNEDLTRVPKNHAGSSYLHIHPKFLHSNATSHKWAFGAIAELLDNAVDEIQNGATYVVVDKTSNPRNGSPSLLIQDDGAGMDPEAMRRCLSFGFSDKKSKSAIGKYGNGFKTSSIRLGGDAIVFSRNFVDRTLTQSIGLLSYTFLTRSGYDRIVVPMVHYEFNFMTGSFESLQSKSHEQSNTNLSVLLKWSPYSTEEELLKQDIRIRWDGKGKAKDDSLKAISENHIANRLRYSLRAYLSVLYLKLPDTFCIVLRGKVVLYYNIATDLKIPEFILYKPNSSGCVEGSVVTTIGFLKEAPDVNIHGFNIYHKGRLILPFLPVVNMASSRGRGVVGVLEANFIEPTHSKQDFEKTNVFQKLVARLKDMTFEYWDCHCGLIGYQIPKKARPPLASSTSTQPPVASRNPTIEKRNGPPIITVVNSRVALNANFSQGSNLKRKLPDQPDDFQSKSQMTKTSAADTGANTPPDSAQTEKKRMMLQKNKKLQEQCLEFKRVEEELNLKVMELKAELGEAQKEYAALLAELKLLEKVEGETNTHLYNSLLP